MDLSITNVSKKYGNTSAVEDISLSIGPGVFGLLGANGAGKTTLIRMITGILKPDTGGIYYDGASIISLDSKFRDLLGYLPQEFGFFPEYRVTDYLEYIATLKGLKKSETKQRIEELMV